MKSEGSEGSERTVLRVQGVGLEVEGRPLLRDVSFSLDAGDALAVVGPNGAGKTTLLRCILCAHHRFTGKIELGGRPVRSLRARERARLLSYVPQLDGRALPFRVREFVEMGRYPHQEPLAGPTPRDREAVDEALSLTGLAELAGRRLATLSGGERQQAFMAAALAQGGSLLLLDEPTAFLDYAHQVRVHEIIESVRAETGTAIVLVTHDVNEALLVADRAVALREGGVVAEGTVEVLADPEVLESIYGVGFARVAGSDDAHPLVFPRSGGSRATGSATPRAEVAGSTEVRP